MSLSSTSRPEQTFALRSIAALLSLLGAWLHSANRVGTGCSWSAARDSLIAWEFAPYDTAKRSPDELDLMENQLATLANLRQMGVTNDGLAYNFSHARSNLLADSHSFARIWRQIQPPSDAEVLLRDMLVGLDGIAAELRSPRPAVAAPPAPARPWEAALIPA